VQKAAQDYKFNATLKPRLDRAIEDWHEAQPSSPEPVIKHFPDGGMSIHAPWSDGYQQDPPR
jgi:hypothetical protein